MYQNIKRKNIKSEITEDNKDM